MEHKIHRFLFYCLNEITKLMMKIVMNNTRRRTFTMNKKSLGILRINKNRNNSKSPYLVGSIRIQRHHMNAFFQELEDEGDTEVIGQLAAWKMNDENGTPFLNIEIQPRWNSTRQTEPEKKKASIFDIEDDF